MPLISPANIAKVVAAGKKAVATYKAGQAAQRKPVKKAAPKKAAPKLPSYQSSTKPTTSTTKPAVLPSTTPNASNSFIIGGQAIKKTTVYIVGGLVVLGITAGVIAHRHAKR